MHHDDVTLLLLSLLNQCYASHFRQRKNWRSLPEDYGRDIPLKNPYLRNMFLSKPAILGSPPRLGNLNMVRYPDFRFLITAIEEKTSQLQPALHVSRLRALL